MQWPILAGVPEEDARQVLSIARRRTFARREVVFHHGDPADSLHLVHTGRFAVRIQTPLGDTVMLSLLGPGETFGEIALLDGVGPRSATVVALEKAETRAIHKLDFDALVARHPGVADLLARALAARVRRLSDLLLEAHYVPADKRVLRRLAEFGLGDGDRAAHPGGAREPRGHLAGDRQPRRARRAGARRARAAPRPHRGARRGRPGHARALIRAYSVGMSDAPAGLILAAGAGRRFGGTKQLAELRGRPLLEYAIESMLAVEVLDPVIVVLGHAADRILDTVDFGDAEVVICAEWERGQAASLRRGLAALYDADAAVVTLGDQPFITPQVIAGALDQLDGYDAVRAVYDGQPGHPVVLSRAVMDAAAALDGDVGARDLLARFRVKRWEAGHLASAVDVDTREELQSL